jgi:hypothetical protein
MIERLAGMGLTCFREIIYPILQTPKILRRRFVTKHFETTLIRYFISAYDEMKMLYVEF